MVCNRDSCPDVVSKLLTFSAPRMVVVQDWRLGCTHRLLQLMFVFVLIVVPMTQGNWKQFSRPANPTVTMSVWPDPGRDPPNDDIYSQQRNQSTSIMCDTSGDA